ncbi:MAG: lipoprotein [Thalassotalea sp.]|nr:lipoprotein [Thalassotalea sp.]
MRKILATTLFAALLTGCSAPDYQAMPIQEIVETTTVQEKHVWATTEFVIKGMAKDAEVKKEDGT